MNRLTVPSSARAAVHCRVPVMSPAPRVLTAFSSKAEDPPDPSTSENTVYCPLVPCNGSDG